MEDYNEPVYFRHKTRLQRNMEAYEEAEREEKRIEFNSDRSNTGNGKDQL